MYASGMTHSWYEDRNISAGSEIVAGSSRVAEEFLRSKGFRRQFHRGRASGLDTRKMQRRFRQHPFHEEAAGHELGGQIGRRAAARNLVLRDFRHSHPHI